MSADGYWSVPLEVQCPHCGERTEIMIENDLNGSLVQDCAVCCSPWQLTVTHDRYGDPDVKVERLD
ncbi:MAG TPA: CPXCG motif-containing cysteine-rich protein [Thermoanaerobaculia bacterium]|nr:CPXCG motif-containing cysteine-rich protein [Thermoanaerobaculia bacterium]